MVAFLVWHAALSKAGAEQVINHIPPDFSESGRMQLLLAASDCNHTGLPS
jgi:hypothetical protein